MTGWGSSLVTIPLVILRAAYVWRTYGAQEWLVFWICTVFWWVLDWAESIFEGDIPSTAARITPI